MKLYQYKISEEELVAKLKMGDKAAFSVLYDSFSRNLLGVIRRIVTNDPPASDILEETFIKIWKNIPKYEQDKSTLFTWMLNISRNTSIDHLRSSQEKRNKKSVEIEKNTTELDHRYQNQFSVNAIGVPEIVNKLDQKHREIIDLAYFEGYTQSEIAELLNIPLGTVKTRVKQAMTELRIIMVDISIK